MLKDRKLIHLFCTEPECAKTSTLLYYDQNSEMVICQSCLAIEAMEEEAEDYELQAERLRELIEANPADIKLLKAEYLELTGLNYRRRKDK